MKAFICYKTEDMSNNDSEISKLLTKGIVDDMEIINLIKNIESFNPDGYGDENVLTSKSGSILISNDPVLILYTLNCLEKPSMSIGYFDINYSVKAVPSKASVWSDEEVEALKTLFPIYDTKDIVKVLISRSVDSIRKKARSLHLTKENHNINLMDSIKYITPKIKLVNKDVNPINLNFIDDVMSLIPNFAKTDIEQRIISRYVAKTFLAEDIIKYADHIDIPYAQMLMYTLQRARFDFFDYLEKNDMDSIKDFYEYTMRYDWDSKRFLKDIHEHEEEYFEDVNEYESLYHSMSYKNDRAFTIMFNVTLGRCEMDGNIKNGIDSINFMLSKTNTKLNELLVAEDFIAMSGEQYFFELISYLSNDEFKRYLSYLCDNDIPDRLYNKQLADALVQRYDPSLNVMYSNLLAICIQIADTKMVDRLLDIYINNDLIVTEKLVAVLSASSYYSAMLIRKIGLNKFKLDENVHIEKSTFLSGMMECSVTNNSVFAKVIYSLTKNDIPYYSIDDYDTPRSIAAIFSSIRRHFLNYGNTDIVDKIFDEE